MKIFSFFLVLFSISTILISITIFEFNLITPEESIIINFINYIFIIIAICFYLKINSSFIILNPLFATLIAFGFSFYLPSITDKFSSPDDFMTYNKENVSKTIILTSLSLISIICGYFIYNQFLKNKVIYFIKKNTNFRISNHINFKNFYFLFFFVTFLRIFSIISGTYGYSSGQEMIENAPIYSNIINTIAGFGDTLFILVTIIFISKIYNNIKIKIIFYFLFIIQIIFGILSGFKGGIIFPFIIYLLIYFLINKKIHYKFIFLLFFGIIFSFFLVEPYRQLKKINPEFKITSISIIEYQEMYSNFDFRSFFNSDDNLFVKYVFRKNLLQTSSAGINYFEKHNENLDKDSPQFLSKLFMSPLLTFIPRFIWKNKPINLDGLWYSNEVLSIPFYTFSPPGKLIYLYFAGGISILIIGFLIMGILQGFLVSIVGNSTISIFTIFVFFHFYDMSTSLEQSYDYYLIGIFQSIMILIIIYKFIFKRVYE